VKKEGYETWALWVGFLTHRDNLGFFDGGNGTLKDAFFPHDDTINFEKLTKMKKALHDEGLIILYQVEGIEYVLCPKVNNFNKLTGNLSDHTDYPAPPKDVITAWERRMNDVYTPLIRCSDSVRTEGKDKGKDKYKDIDEKIINSRLGKIATKDMIKAFLKEVPRDQWWKVSRFLIKRYPDGGDRAFAEAEREVVKEKRAQ
jgi:hypothetical protein